MRFKITFFLSLLLVPFKVSSTTTNQETFSTDTHVNFRLRYEDVSVEENSTQDAQALTLRSRINFKFGQENGFSGLVEIDQISVLGIDNYNDTINGKSSYAKIVDPAGSDLNQAWIGYKSSSTQLKFGRQRILLDNQRFIGGVGFRQNEQTYDAFSLKYQGPQDLSVYYAHIDQVNRIFGDKSVNGKHQNSTNLLNIKAPDSPIGKFTAYAYLINNKQVSRFSTNTYGLNLTHSLGPLDYIAEYAYQKSAGNNLLDYHASYKRAVVSFTETTGVFSIGYENLGSDKALASFITPLATLHKFQGWTDQFLVTPKEGISDLFLSFTSTIKGVKIKTMMHQFKSDRLARGGFSDLGSEFALSGTKKLGRFNVGVKYASYKAGDLIFNKVDTEKIWLTMTIQI
jgi:hypothetical protein